MWASSPHPPGDFAVEVQFCLQGREIQFHQTLKPAGTRWSLWNNQPERYDKSTCTKTIALPCHTRTLKYLLDEHKQASTRRTATAAQAVVKHLSLLHPSSRGAHACTAKHVASMSTNPKSWCMPDTIRRCNAHTVADVSGAFSSLLVCSRLLV